MQPDKTKLSFWTGANYMKRLALASNPYYKDTIISAYATNDVVIGHNLGYIPDYETSVEYLSDGMIWKGNIPYVAMEGYGGTPPASTSEEWIDTSNLTVAVTNNTGSTITVRVHYTIYKDYSNV